jgi:hypothetical protein
MQLLPGELDGTEFRYVAVLGSVEVKIYESVRRIFYHNIKAVKTPAQKTKGLKDKGNENIYGKKFSHLQNQPE